ncbi:MAG: DUF2461 domain-containing protein [Ilumatobacteraceae bacterium]
MSFRGFPDDVFRFYEELATDNSRTWWHANKHRYQESVRGPLDELLGDLSEYGPFHVFRPYKDVRFSKDKVPYKDHQGAYGESEGGAGFYVQISANGLMTGAGYYVMASDQLARFREAIDSDVLGPEIERLASAVVAKGLRLGSIGELKTAPRGYPKDHPRIALLRRKGLMASRTWEPAAWMRTKAVVGRVRDAWSVCDEMNAWLDLHVGPSTLAPDEDEIGRFGPF